MTFEEWWYHRGFPISVGWDVKEACKAAWKESDDQWKQLVFCIPARLGNPDVLAGWTVDRESLTPEDVWEIVYATVIDNEKHEVWAALERYKADQARELKSSENHLLIMYKDGVL